MFSSFLHIIVGKLSIQNTYTESFYTHTYIYTTLLELWKAHLSILPVRLLLRYPSFNYLFSIHSPWYYITHVLYRCKETSAPILFETAYGAAFIDIFINKIKLKNTLSMEF